MIDTIEQIFGSAAYVVEIAVDALAVLMVGVAACDAAFRSLQNAFRPSRSQQLRTIWLNFAGWILLALEFSLGADVIGSAIAPSWDTIGKLGAIAVIRTFLSFFLARDFKDARTLAAGGSPTSDT
jgi:uncharacterized membrane protein